MNVTVKAASLLSKEESAELAGVSLDTIEKYMQIGLLEPSDTADDGSAYFRESDIRSLFYTRQSHSVHDAELPPSSFDLATSKDDDTLTAPEEEQNVQSNVLPFRESDSQVSQDTRVGLEAAVAAQGLHNEETPSESSSEKEIDEAPEEQPEEQSETKEESTEQGTEAGSVTSYSTIDAIAPSSIDSVETKGSEASESNLSDLAQLSQLRELNLSLREQIVTLKEERDWLRNRIEQLELRGEREQMLLLSESETVRRLVSQKSITERVFQTFRLPWLQNEKK